MSTQLSELAESLFSLVEACRTNTDVGSEELREVYVHDELAACSMAADILIDHDVKLPEDVYEKFKEFGESDLDYLHEEFEDLQEIYLRK
ncbi:MAG: hypothetical protein Q4A71_03075 [Actinomycetaceae bacterium]|nr:hypothetical protein [Actinomycetaceae bacterium]